MRFNYLNMKQLFVVLAFAFFLHATSNAQIMIVPNNNQFGHITMEDLWKITIVNTGKQPVGARVEILLQDDQNNLVLSATTQEITLAVGSNHLIKSIKQSNIQFGSSRSAKTFQSTGRLPYGNYTVCYQIIDNSTGHLAGQFCLEQTSKPMSPPELIYPYNESSVYITNPILVWKPPFPTGSDPFQYTIRMVEVKNGTQNSLDAIEQNFPVLSRNRLYSKSLIYPSDAIKLQYGKTYAWQVVASINNNVIGATEVWTFQIEQEQNSEKSASSSPVPPYRTLQLTTGSAYNIANDEIKFLYDNRYGRAGLRYGSPPTVHTDSVYFQIFPVGTPNSALNSTTVKTLQLGVNKIVVDLQSMSGIVDDEYYVMVLTEPNGKKYYIDFQFNDN